MWLILSLLAVKNTHPDSIEGPTVEGFSQWGDWRNGLAAVVAFAGF
jgi:hypothetical protein